MIERFDHRHFRAQSRVHIGEFQPDVAAADDRHPLGHGFQPHRFIAGEDRFAIQLNSRRHKGHRPGRNQNIAGANRFGDRAVAVGGVHFHFLGSQQFAPTLDDVYANPLQAVGQIALDFAHEISGVVGDRLAIELHAAHLNPHGFEVCGIAKIAHPAGSRQQGLGRNATPVNAGAAHFGRFHDRRFQATGDGVQCCTMAADSGSEDQQVVVEFLSHARLLGLDCSQSPHCPAKGAIGQLPPGHQAAPARSVSPLASNRLVDR